MPQSQYNHVQSRISNKLAVRGVGGMQLKGVYPLRCGHDSRGPVVIAAPGRERRKDWFMCSQGCGLQKRKS